MFRIIRASTLQFFRAQHASDRDYQAGLRQRIADLEDENCRLRVQAQRDSGEINRTNILVRDYSATIDRLHRRLKDADDRLTTVKAAVDPENTVQVFDPEPAVGETFAIERPAKPENMQNVKFAPHWPAQRPVNKFFESLTGRA